MTYAVRLRVDGHDAPRLVVAADSSIAALALASRNLESLRAGWPDVFAGAVVDLTYYPELVEA